MRKRTIAAVLVLTGCEATFESQARDTFADAFACKPEHVDVAPARAVVDDVSYAVVRVDGCGRHVKYVCASDWTIGCAPPKRATRASPAGTSPGTSFPASLVDQAPLPPPPSHEEEGD